MSNLQNIQNKVSVVSIFLFKEETKIPKTIKECDAKLANYYNWYGETYLSVCKKQNIKIVLTGKM